MTQSKQQIAIQASIRNRVGKLSSRQVEKELTGLRKIIKANKTSLPEDRLTEHEKQTFLALKASKTGNRPMRFTLKGKHFEGTPFGLDKRGVVRELALDSKGVAKEGVFKK